MKRKILVFAILAVMIVSSLALVACSDTKDKDIYPNWAYEKTLYTEDASINGDSNLRIMSYNVLVEAWNKQKKTDINDPIRARVEQASKVINHYSPDVIGLQELCEKWHKYLPKKIENYEVIFDGMFEYTSMAYNKTKVNLIESGKVKYSKRSESKMRYAAWALFEKKDSKDKFVVINTHFDFGDAKKEIQKVQMKEFGDLGKQLEEKYNAPVFLVGDYNTYDYEITDKNNKELYEGYQGVALFNKFKEDVKDNFKDTQYTEGIKIIEGEKRKASDPKWDHIFASNSVKVNAYAVLSNKFYTSISDHFPIFVDVKIGK